ncbi:amine dehydrogenase large subunit [Altericroceibacterium spongiae]|uniref:amine dehydrogenase large subunit n=1 Tax=Altericroceibacterium spongiae TaxID=2320269 RepID=UPI001601DBD3|nr:amine dehydrogenase large subunit [Altericroceibacterium spongiae]
MPLKKFRQFTIVLAALSASTAFAQSDDTAPAVPEVEESDVAVLPDASSHWFLSFFSFRNPAQLINGDTGKLLGSVHVAPMSNIAFAPDRKHIYVAETIWTKGNRGTRQDMITVYDGRTLKLDYEITLPGRLLVGLRNNTLSLSADGRYAYVYDMSPASSIIIVDLEKREVAASVEIPGCAMAFAAGNEKILSICGDGSFAITTHSGDTANVEQTEPFFPVDDDPIYDNSVLDPATGKGYFLSYSGLVYEVIAGGTVQTAEPWSLQEGAHMPRATTEPLIVSWLPGGLQPIAYHPETGRLYVLMHKGEFWSFKEAGEELWEVDAATHKVLRRVALKQPITSVAITGDDAPLLLLGGGDGSVHIWDAASLSEKSMFHTQGPSTFVVMP